MNYIYKIIFALVMMQVAVVLAKPYEPENGDKLQPFYGVREYFVHKRAGKGYLQSLTQVFIRC